MEQVIAIRDARGDFGMPGATSGRTEEVHEVCRPSDPGRLAARDASRPEIVEFELVADRIGPTRSIQTLHYVT
jgi:hypothetical protein